MGEIRRAVYERASHHKKDVIVYQEVFDNTYTLKVCELRSNMETRDILKFSLPATSAVSEVLEILTAKW